MSIRGSISVSWLNATDLATIRAAQTNVATADPLTALVDTDGFQMKTDNLHFNGLVQQKIGDATAIQLLNLYPTLSPLVIAARSGGNFDIRIQEVFEGFQYTLEGNPDLNPNHWQVLGTTPANGAFINFSHKPGAGVAREFFRVARTLAP